jgi:hypothetical protein
MKKIFLIFLLIFASFMLSAQKNSSFFLSFEPQFGFPVGKTVIELSEYIGFHSQREYYGPVDPQVMPFTYGIGIQGGINIKDMLLISSGVNYNKRKDQLTLYCHVCDFVMPPTPEKFALSIIQVPLSLRMNLNRRAKIFPFVSGGVSWNQLFENDQMAAWSGGLGDFNFWSYSVGGGLGLRTQKNTEFLFMTQYHRDISDRSGFPNLVFRDLSFALMGVFKFSSGE